MLLDEGERDLLCLYVAGQLNAFSPIEARFRRVSRLFSRVLERVEFCFSHIADRYFSTVSGCFSVICTEISMACSLLPFEYSQNGRGYDCLRKTLALNKTLHGVDAFYEVSLPDVFRWVHPLGTVLGEMHSTSGVSAMRIGSNKGVLKMGSFVRASGSSILGGVLWVITANWAQSLLRPFA